MLLQPLTAGRPFVRNLSSLPDFRSRRTGLKSELEYLSRQNRCAEQLEAIPHSILEITAYDGVALTGHWYPCEQPGRILIAMHGWQSSWSRDFGTMAEFWRRSGCSVLFAEQRETAGIPEEISEFGFMGPYDCIRWVNWVSRRFGTELPIYLAGISLGATTVLNAVGLDLPPNVHGILADSGFTSLSELRTHIFDRGLSLPCGINEALTDLLCRKDELPVSRACSTVSALQQSSVPVLLIHGENDRFVPPEMTVRNFRSCAGPREMYLCSGAEHGRSYDTDPDRYQQVLTRFWAKYDL